MNKDEKPGPSYQLFRDFAIIFGSFFHETRHDDK